MAMNPPLQHMNYEAVIKCSFCAADIGISAVAEHICHSTGLETQGPWLYGNLPLPVQQTHSTQQYNDVSGSRDLRPALPKLDSSVNNRSGLRPSEAASIAHDLGLPSPMSAGSSGHKSPHRSRSRSRKAAVPRPPSPDGPISQDCAFPPFPMKPKPKQPSREGSRHKGHSTSRSTTSTKTYQHSSSQSNASSVYSAGSGAVKRRTSNTSSGQRSRQGTGDDSISLSSTAPDSPLRSGPPPFGRGHSVDQTQSPLNLVSCDSYSSSEPSSSISTMPPTPSWPMETRAPSPKIVQSPSSDIGWTPTEHAIPEEQMHESDSLQHLKNNRSRTETFDKILSPDSVPANASMFDNPPKEPLYKTKRPPPLLQAPSHNVDDPQMPRSARAPPPPSSHGGLKRSLTNLFSRKQSQSSVKMMPLPTADSLRIRALAPDPPERPKRGESLWDDAAPGASNSHKLAISTASQDQVDPSLRDTSAADDNQHLTVSSPPDQYKNGPLVESKEESSLGNRYGTYEERHNDNGAKGLWHSQPDQPTTVPTSIPSKEAPNQEDLQRVSIDSASSYGSIGFSNRTASSRSSHPISDDMKRKGPPALDISQSQMLVSDISPPRQLYLQNTVPESPTDPLYSAGKLSPVAKLGSTQQSQGSDMDERLQQSLLTPPSDVHEREISKPSRPETPAGVKGRCRGCSKFIHTGQKSVSSADGRLSGKYHKECFTCQTCKEPFATADFYVFSDHPYCAHHYHVLNNTLCIGCGKGIEGEYLETFDVAGSSSKKFHPKCLQCATCKVQLNDDYFEFHGRVYCERDAFRAASGPKNPYDTVPSRPSPLVREYINSEEPGFKGRFPERRTTRLIMT